MSHFPHQYQTSDNTKKKEKAYGNALKYRVGEVWRREVLQVFPSLPAGSKPERRIAVFVNHKYADLFRKLLTPALYLRTFSAAYYLFRIRTQDQNIIPHKNPDPIECDTRGALDPDAIPGATVPSVQEGFWSVKRTCVSRARVCQHKLIR